MRLSTPDSLFQLLNQLYLLTLLPGLVARVGPLDNLLGGVVRVSAEVALSAAGHPDLTAPPSDGLLRGVSVVVGHHLFDTFLCLLALFPLLPQQILLRDAVLLDHQDYFLLPSLLQVVSAHCDLLHHDLHLSLLPGLELFHPLLGALLLFLLPLRTLLSLQFVSLRLNSAGLPEVVHGQQFPLLGPHRRQLDGRLPLPPSLLLQQLHVVQELCILHLLVSLHLLKGLAVQVHDVRIPILAGLFKVFPMLCLEGECRLLVSQGEIGHPALCLYPLDLPEFEVDLFGLLVVLVLVHEGLFELVEHPLSDRERCTS